MLRPMPDAAPVTKANRSARDPMLADQARQQGDGWVFMVDLRVGETDDEIETEELIRQIPSDTAVRIATAMREMTQQGSGALPPSGRLLDEQA